MQILRATNTQTLWLYVTQSGCMTHHSRNRVPVKTLSNLANLVHVDK